MAQNTFITPFFAVARSNRNNTRNRQETFRDFAMDDAGLEFTRNPSNAWRTGDSKLAVKVAQELLNSKENASDGWDFYAVEVMERTAIIRIVDELDCLETTKIIRANGPVKCEKCEGRDDCNICWKGKNEAQFCPYFVAPQVDGGDAEGAGEGAAK